MKISPEDIRKKIAAHPPRERGDHSLNPDLLPEPPYRVAAVLIPLLRREEGYTVLFTERSAHLNTHAGQVSFPGGGAEETDADVVETALRETQEEIGLAPLNVTVLGTLDRYITRTGFCVAPVVGIIVPPPAWTPNSFEVSRIFEVPLSYILSPGALTRQQMVWEGMTRHYEALTWQDFYIWGPTAGMLKNFVDILTHE